MKKMYVLILLLLSSCFSSHQAWHMGEDSNNDGVRDDIALWISEKYKENKNLQKALLALAKVDPASCDYRYQLGCLSQISEDSFIIELELLEKTLDTNQRREAYEARIQKCAIQDDRNLNMKCSF